MNEQVKGSHIASIMVLPLSFFLLTTQGVNFYSIKWLPTGFSEVTCREVSYTVI